MKSRVLIVDDDPFTRKLFQGLLRGNAFALQTAINVADARKALRATDFNLVILDQRLPDGNGLDLFSEVRSERPRQLAILITGHAEVRDAVRAVREGLFDYLTKPFENLEELEAVIGKALEMDRAYREIDILRETLEARPGAPLIISCSSAMEKVMLEVRQAAPLDTTVLIDGESGTGKEIIAKQIHALSKRAKQPLLEINCGALPESLLEATLFGYEKGAFTSAAKMTSGYFEEADGGTLFLDEIADMSPKLQASLLRVLQERSFARLGSTVQRPSDFRLICATNKSLELEMQAGNFRADLYYRINVVVVRLPPLRQRREDVVPMALFFLDYFNRKFGKQAGPFTPEAIAALECAPWPGNVRELKHAVERAVVINADGPIAPSSFGILGKGLPSITESASLLPYREAQEDFQRAYFKNLLESTDGNISEAARLSGIARQNVYGHIERLGLVMKS
ncbi:MAG: sigma-54 dependent transcriptional regulator [Proteobacteria bacterium]|nr:sigma-54 dependent transcriptional regulator [Pseudomonadota bacterium]